MAQVRVSVCVCSVVWCPCHPHIAQAVVADRLSLFRTVMPPVVQYPVHDVSYPFFKVRAALLALPLTVLLTMLRDCATHHATCRATHHATCLCYSPCYLLCYSPCYLLCCSTLLPNPQGDPRPLLRALARREGRGTARPPYVPRAPRQSQAQARHEAAADLSKIRSGQI